MGEAFITRRGGSGNKVFAVVSATYPAGSICTCSNGSKTLTAKDTSGYALFPVKAGTYTVECHTVDNSKSKSASVTVAESDRGKSVSVTLSYELLLFNGGVVEPWTVISAKPTATISDTIYLYAADPTTPVVSAVRTTNQIDLSGYSELKYTVTENKTKEIAYVCITSSTAAPITAGSSNTVKSSVVAYGQPSSTGTYSVDVSGVTGSYYISLAEGHYPTSGLRVSKVWLE